MRSVSVVMYDRVRTQRHVEAEHVAHYVKRMWLRIWETDIKTGRVRKMPDDLRPS